MTDIYTAIKNGEIRVIRSRFTPLEHRFWAKVDKDGPQSPHADGPCWVWTGSLTSKSYGRIRIKWKWFSTHRTSWLIHNGPIPDGMIVLHKCDTPRCIRPDHLSLGTPADNSADMADKCRSTFGERNPRAKLTEREVIQMRAEYVPNHPIFGLTPLARKYGITPGTIHGILNGHRWKYLLKANNND